MQTAPPSPTTRSDRKFRPDIEGLRAVAVLLVVLEHAGVTLVSGGYIGVDVFFVLSGFLITGLLIREVQSTGKISLGQFYARRARRLLPAATVILLVTVWASFHWLGAARGNRVAVDAIWATLFASNFRSIQLGTDYLGAQLPPSPLQHYWSLAVEEQFYVVWPLLIMGAAMVFRQVSLRLRLGVVLTALILGSLAWSVYQTAENGTAAYFSPFTRTCELAAGALLAVTVPQLIGRRRWVGVVLSWAGLVGIVSVALWYTPATIFPGLAVILPVVASVALVAGGTIAPGGGAEAVLKLLPFQWLGKLSYSLYLWHWPMLVIPAQYAGRELSLMENLGICVVAIGLSVVTYFLVENPIRSWKVLTSRAPRLSIGFGVALLAISLATTTLLAAMNPVPREEVIEIAETDATELPTPGVVLQEVKASTLATDWPEQPARLVNPAYRDECNVTRADTTSAACVHGDPEAERSIVVFGDSHGAMWIPAFEEIGRQGGWQIVQLTKPGCQVPDYPGYSNALGREYTECAEFREFAINKIVELQPDVVVVTSARKGVQMAKDGTSTTDGIEEAWAAGLGSVLDRIAPNTDRMIVLGDVPYPSQGGIDCLTAHESDVMACSTPVSTAVYADHNAMEEDVAMAHGAQYVSTIPWFCTSETCPAVIGGLTTRRDAHHVAENYAHWLSVTLGVETGLLNPDGGSPEPPAKDPVALRDARRGATTVAIWWRVS
ncbi:MAG TPA: acyltransferase family protein [Thermomicrobiales bacterium]|nr:acyltransferase family protein [Thermomicrobiales bacterium]